MGDGFGIQVDATKWEAFALAYKAEAGRAGVAFLQQGALLIQREVAREARTRFGVETVESRMQTVDPLRPRGSYVGSLRAQLEGETAITVAPHVPYAWWVEQGSRAPAGVPARNQRSAFQGHRPMERGSEAAEPQLPGLLERLMQAAATNAGA